MRSIFRAALAAAVAGSLAIGAAASAQDMQSQGGGQGRGGCMREAMAKLSPPLTDDQKAQLKALRESGQKGEDRQAAVAKILSPEQIAQLRDARKACAAGGGQG
jgi:Spy/CpxP family protein refolding chaperone